MNASHKRQGYLLAVGVSAAVLVARYGLHEPLGEQAMLMPFVLAVIVAAWRGGLGPGLLATALCIASALFVLVPPQFSLTAERLEHGATVATFGLIGVTVSALCESLHAERRRETEKQFRMLADSIPQLVWMARADGHRFWYNRRWYDFTGTRPGESAGHQWPHTHDGDELQRVVQSWHRALATGEVWEDTFPLRRHDGQVRWFLARAVPIRDESGRVTRWFGTNTDISQLHEMEEALRAVDRRKDEFLAMLAHELRGPLAPVVYALELWPSVADNAAEMDELRVSMQRHVRMLGRLIDDLLDVSRIRNGKLHLVLGVVDVREPVAQAIEMNQPLTEANRQRVIWHTRAGPVLVRGDAARLLQVFSNLIHNAAKYTPQGGTISVDVRAHDNQAAIWICDDGQGIPRHMLDSIFHLFEQVEATQPQSRGGLGIGLTLVKRLVELHGGDVQAHSEGPGHGSRFVVTLPLYRGAADATRPNGPGMADDATSRHYQGS